MSGFCNFDFQKFWRLCQNFIPFWVLVVLVDGDWLVFRCHVTAGLATSHLPRLLLLQQTHQTRDEISSMYLLNKCPICSNLNPINLHQIF